MPTELPANYEIMVDELLLCYFLAIFCIHSTPSVDAQQRSHGGDYCDTEVFRAECSEGELIVIERALYGRMKLGRCVEIDIGYLGCHRDVINMADRRCSGRRVCEIRIPDAEFESTRACLKELKTYLDVVYRCITPESINADICRWQDSYNVSVMTSHHTAGYLSSGAMSEVPVACNRPDRPWTISVRPGQRINLTLYNFTPFRLTHPFTSFLSATGLSTFDETVENPTRSHLGKSIGSTVSSTSSYRCHQLYGRIEDNGSPYRAPLRICGSEKRTEHLMLSRGNMVRIWLDVGHHHRIAALSSSEESPEPPRFLVQYTVIGCPNLDHVSDLATFHRINFSRAAIHCRYSDAKWYLQCEQGSWTGTYGNCTRPVTSVRPTMVTTVTTTRSTTVKAITKTTFRSSTASYAYEKPDPDVLLEPAARNRPALESTTGTVFGIGLLAIIIITAICVLILVIALCKQSRRSPRSSSRGRSGEQCIDSVRVGV